MRIQPIPHEQGRFVVQSESRPDVAFVVDLRYQETRTSKPVAGCGCERSFCHGEICKHILGVIAYEQNRLQIRS